jgi:hypothetical protein
VKLFLPGYIEDNESVGTQEGAHGGHKLFSELHDFQYKLQGVILFVEPEVLSHLHLVAW